MNTDGALSLIITSAQTPVISPLHGAENAIRMLLEDTRSECTKRAYQNDLGDFFRWHTGTDATPEALAALCSHTSGQLALVLNGYKAHQRERGMRESTVNRRLSAVRSLLRMCRKLGMECPDPAGLVKSEKVQSYRDTRGPAQSEAKKLVAAPNRETLRGKRDFALLRLMLENALRRAEVTQANVGDFDAAEGTLAILGKGSGSQKARITLSEATTAAIVEYLTARGLPNADAPLFTNLAHFSNGEQRLSGDGLAHIVREYGVNAIGKKLSPHKLRHSAITSLLDASGGNVRMAQKLSRHKSLNTLTIYDDNRSDAQGEATRILSSLLD